MSRDEKQKGFSWFVIILVGIILVLFSMYMNQSQENDKAKQVFAGQTAQAEYQRSISLTATKQMENKVKGCTNSEKAGIPLLNQSNCVVDIVYDVQEMESSSDEPKGYITLFSPAPNTFFLYGPYDTSRYVGKCVRVSGEVIFTRENIPAMYVEEYGDNIEELPDNMCQP